jgi:hypothetical protein
VKKLRRIDTIRARAYELARSGAHADCVAVEGALQAEGYPDAPSALSDPAVHGHVEQLCGEHRETAPAQAARDQMLAARLLRTYSRGL